jgi:hypothetical protein
LLQYEGNDPENLCGCGLRDPDDLRHLAYLNPDYHINKDCCGRIEPSTVLYCLKLAAYDGGAEWSRGVFSLVIRCVSEHNQVFERIGSIFQSREGVKDGRWGEQEIYDGSEEDKVITLI